MQNFSKLFKKIEQFDVVSFDIFDTLLKRDVKCPTDVFRIVELRYDSLYSKTKSDFFLKRREAEKNAREKSIYAEITLDEIYDVIDYSEKEKKLLKQIEMEAEASILHSNAVIKSLFKKCIDEKKTVYIVSDMYLPLSFLEKILEREGISGYKKLFLSCVYRKTKRSGQLFESLLKEEDVSSSQVIHIGDSKYADYIGPRKKKIHSIYINRQVHNTLYVEKPKDNVSISEKCIYSFVNTRVDAFESRNIRLGYEVLGPIIYAYCQWLHNTVTKRKDNSKIWFAARDMYLFESAYRRIYGETNEIYIYLSRNSLRPVYAQAVKDITKSGDVFARGNYSLRKIIEYLGYSLEEAEIEKNLDVDKQKYDIRKLNSYPEVVHALSSLVIQQREKNLASLGCKYLSENGLFNYNIVFADVGWHGTTQYILQEIKKINKADTKIFGMYIGCLDGTKEKLGEDNYNSFVFDENDDNWFIRGILLFECLILAPHGSAKSYVEKGECVEPVLGENVIISPFIKEVQKGAELFIDDFTKSILSDTIELKPQYVSKAFEILTYKPQKEEIEAIGDLDYDNFYCNKMAAPKHLRYYILHIGELKKDIKYSPWRIGFLYRLFKLRLPYAKIYSFIRKKQGKMT